MRNGALRAQLGERARRPRRPAGGPRCRRRRSTPTAPVRSGRDSMRVMLTPCVGERRRAARAPRRACCRADMHERGAGRGRSARRRCCPSTRKRVVLFGLVLDVAREDRQAVALAAAASPAIAAAPVSFAARRAASALLATGDALRAAAGCCASQPWHCARRLRVRVDALDRLEDAFALRSAGSGAPAASTSPQMRSGVASSRSSVRPTAPSVEFSTGTTANCAAPDSALRNTSSIEAQRLAPRRRRRNACAPPAR